MEVYAVSVTHIAPTDVSTSFQKLGHFAPVIGRVSVVEVWFVIHS